VCDNEGYDPGFAVAHFVTIADQSQEPALGPFLDLDNAIGKRHDEAVYATALLHNNGRGATMVCQIGKTASC